MIVPMDRSQADFDPPVFSNEIALDEALDALDPLRHLRGDESLGNDDDSQSVVPVQPRSTHNELIRLSFPDRGCSTAVHVMLKVDASPGCGGIAWPAGEVRISILGSLFFAAIGKINRSQVLANYLALRGEKYCTGKTILELGSGTGLVGLVVGKLDGKVWITDQASVSTPRPWFIMRDSLKLHRPLLGIMQANVKLNQLESSVIVSELNW